MRAIEIRRNGTVVCVAAYPQANLLAVDLSANVEGTTAALSVHGMAALENGTNLHLWWCNDQQIADGDELLFQLIETETTTPPSEIEASDSEEFIAKQEEYEKEISDNPVTPRPMARTHAGVAFEITINTRQVTARLEEPREFLLAILTWSNFGEERTRLSARSFSQAEALSRTGGKDWIADTFNLNQALSIRVLYKSPLDPDAMRGSA